MGPKATAKEWYAGSRLQYNTLGVFFKITTRVIETPSAFNIAVLQDILAKFDMEKFSCVSLFLDAACYWWSRKYLCSAGEHVCWKLKLFLTITYFLGSHGKTEIDGEIQKSSVLGVMSSEKKFVGILCGPFV